MQFETFGANPGDAGDVGGIGYVAPVLTPAQIYASSHDAGDLTYEQSLSGGQKAGIGALVLVAIGAWLLLKR